MAEGELNESLVDRLLKGAFGDAPPAAPQPADELPASFSDRYRIEGVIGKGGVGIVLRGRDLELGRDVALKVLRKEHVGHEGLKRRFLEEAQIGGQLEHPGVVPVHEMGRASDDRPFFVMKLIQGRTLGELLGARRDLADDRSRFLAIFEQVALTVAYAHARGVIHRDLKPSNVMVGAFGEVQVADWGLAKVLGRAEPPPDAESSAPGSGPASDPAGGAAGSTARPSSAASGARPISTVRTTTSELLSQAGAVLGTLSYMAPEQARGESERVDARADVFALGAILLEILTGKPPYSGDSGEQFEAARNAVLQPALARLDAAASEPSLAALVTLVKRCLAAEPQGRPADAGAVAHALQEWRASQEQRAHAAELAAAAAGARVEEERRRRRVTLLLAATIVVALLGGGAAWLANERDERSRLEMAAGQVRDALAGAREKARFAAEAPRHATAPREAALAAAEAAQATARAADPGPELRAQVDTLHAEAVAALAAARVVAADRQRDQSTLAALFDQISRWYVAPWDEIDRAFEQAFRAWGLDLATMDDEQCIARIRASSEPVEFCDHMLAWMKVRYELKRLERKDMAEAPRDFLRMRRIMQEADPDPWRIKLRAAIPDNVGYLIEAAHDPALFEQDVRTVAHLASVLMSLNGQVAFELVEKAVARWPDEYLFRYYLGLLAKEAKPKLWSLAVDHASAAVVMAPDAVSGQLLLAVARDGSGDFQGAVAAYAAALRLAPDVPHAVAGRIWSLIYGGRHAEARAAIDALAAAGKLDESTWHARAVVQIAAGELDAARATLHSLQGAAPGLATVASTAMTLGLAGDWAGGAEAARTGLKRVTPIVQLDLVIGLHAVHAYALERAGDLVGALAASKQAEQILLRSGARPETLDRSGIVRIEALQALADALPDYESGALESADALVSARVALLLSRAGRDGAAIDFWEAACDEVAQRSPLLEQEPSLLIAAAGSAARIARSPATSAEQRERAVALLLRCVRAEADDALARQGGDPMQSARSRVHTLLLDPELRLLRDPALHGPFTAEQGKALLLLGEKLREAMRFTRG